MKHFIFLLCVTAFFNTISAQVGRVGINTPNPFAMLHVKDSSVVFTGQTSLLMVPGATPVIGEGVRMMWYPDKAAFRAGYVQTDNWDESNIGNYSVAIGKNTKASGDNSTAMGKFSIAAGTSSIAMGEFTEAVGFASTAMGHNTTAINSSSTAMGESSTASGAASTSMGHHTTSRAFASLTIGHYNDSIITSSSGGIVPTDPVFIIGNGTGFLSRSNALTVLKNGNSGFSITNPAARLHVKNKGISGGTYNAGAVMIMEDNDDSYMQFSHPNNRETGFLSGNASTPIRSAIIFRADSSIFFRTGGNTTRAAINNVGDLGIGTGSPVAKLDVNGDIKLGTNGTVLVSVIKAIVSKNVPSIAANSTLIQTFAVTNAALLSSVMISPSAALNAGMVMGYARVSAVNTVEVIFINTTGAAIDMPLMDFYITVIQ